MHAACQTCTFWLHPGKVWQCYSLDVRLSSAEAMCHAPVRKDETVSEGNWRSPLSATNATGDAIPWDASLQHCFSLLLSQPSLLIVSLLPFVSAYALSSCIQHSFSLHVILWPFYKPARYCRNGRIVASMWALVVFKRSPTSVPRSSQFLPVKN